MHLPWFYTGASLLRKIVTIYVQLEAQRQLCTSNMYLQVTTWVCEQNSGFKYRKQKYKTELSMDVLPQLLEGYCINEQQRQRLPFSLEFPVKWSFRLCILECIDLLILITKSIHASLQWFPLTVLNCLRSFLIVFLSPSKTIELVLVIRSLLVQKQIINLLYTVYYNMSVSVTFSLYSPAFQNSYTRLSSCCLKWKISVI